MKDSINPDAPAFGSAAQVDGQRPFAPYSIAAAILVSLLSVVTFTPALYGQSAEREYKLGKGYYDMGLPERAIPHFEKVRETQDDRAEAALFFLGESYYAGEVLEKAGARYLELVRRFPKTSHRQDSLLRAGECLVKLDRGDQAVTVLQTLLSDPGANRGPGLFWQGEALRRVGRDKDAIATYLEMVRAFPRHELRPYASYNLAGLQHDAGADAEALATLDAVGEIPEPMRPSVRLLKGDLSLAVNDAGRAAKEYNAVHDPALRADALEGIARASRVLERRDLLDLARSELAESFARSPQLARTDLIAGSWAAERGDVDSADRHLEPHVDGVLGEECRFWRGWARGQANRHADAVEIYEPLARRDSAWGTWAHYRLAAELRILERWADALAASNLFVERHGGDTRAAEVLAGAIESAYHLERDDDVFAMSSQFVRAHSSHSLLSDVTRFQSEAALRQENWELAVDGFETILASDVADTTRREALPRLAWAHYRRDGGESTGAIQRILTTLRGLDQVEPSALAEVGLLLGHSQLSGGDADQARASFELASQLDPTGETGAKAALEAATLRAGSEGTKSEKIAAYQSVLSRGAIGTVRSRALLEMSELQAGAGEYDKARPGFVTYIDENPDAEAIGFALLGLAFCEWRLNNYDEAAKRVRQLEAKNFLDRGHELRAEGLFLRAQVAYSKDDSDSAREDFATYLEEFGGGPRERESLRQLAKIAEAAGDKETALGYLSTLTERYSDGADADEALYRRAWLEQETGDSATATQLFSQLLANHPESTFIGDAHYRLADLAYAGERYGDARKHYQEALASPDGDRVGEYARYRIAWSYQHEEKLAEAFEAFAEMASKHSQSKLSGESLFLASEAAKKLSRPADEQRMLEVFTQKHERHQYTNEAKVRLSELLTSREEWPRIRALLSPLEGVELPDTLKHRRLVALGRALTNLGAARTAIGHLEAALDDGKSIAAEAQFELGNAHRALGDKKRAIEVFLSGPILYPFKPWAVRCYLEAGREMIAAGEKTEARRILGFAVKEDPEGPDGKTARELLSNMGGE